MSFIEEIKKKAKANLKTIVLPESTDKRVLEATQEILKEGFAKIILVGNKSEIIKKADEYALKIEGATIIDIETSENLSEYANGLYELRKNKGMTQEQAN